MGRQRLARALSIAVAGLALEAPASPADEKCGLQVISQRDSSQNPQLASVSFSADGRYLAFSSYAALVPGDANGRSDIYVFDMPSGKLTIETLLRDGSQANSDSFHPDISDDGRFLVFQSSGRLTSPTGGQTVQQVVLRDRQLGTTSVLSKNGAGELGNRRSGHAVISANGGVVAFESSATNLVAGRDVNGAASDVYSVVVGTQDIVRQSVNSTGRQLAEGASFSPSISADGQLIAFTSSAWIADEPAPQPTPWPQDRPQRRLAPRSQPEHRNVFVRDLARGTTRRVSRSTEAGSGYLPAISDDGRWVAFVSEAANLVRNDKNRASDVFLHDLEMSTTTLVSRSAGGGTGNGASTGPAISANGQFVVFESEASDLVCSKRCAARDVDINLVSDVFVLDRARGRTTRLSADTKSGWMEISRSPAIAAGGEIIAFSSRRPTDDRDRGDDFDLFVWARCGTEQAGITHGTRGAISAAILEFRARVLVSQSARGEDD
jgi:Tol biopolymer transport system component